MRCFAEEIDDLFEEQFGYRTIEDIAKENDGDED